MAENFANRRFTYFLFVEKMGSHKMSDAVKAIAWGTGLAAESTHELWTVLVSRSGTGVYKDPLFLSASVKKFEKGLI